MASSTDTPGSMRTSSTQGDDHAQSSSSPATSTSNGEPSSSTKQQHQEDSPRRQRMEAVVIEVSSPESQKTKAKAAAAASSSNSKAATSRKRKASNASGDTDAAASTSGSAKPAAAKKQKKSPEEIAAAEAVKAQKAADKLKAEAEKEEKKKAREAEATAKAEAKAVKEAERVAAKEKKDREDAEKKAARELKEQERKEKKERDEAEKAVKDQERAEKKAKKDEEEREKAERKAVKEAAKKAKEEEEAKKEQALKKSSNVLFNFLKKNSATPEASTSTPRQREPSGGSVRSDTPAATTSSATAAVADATTSSSVVKSTGKAPVGFDQVFFDFTVRENVTVAPPNRFLAAELEKEQRARDLLKIKKQKRKAVVVLDSDDEAMQVDEPELEQEEDDELVTAAAGVMDLTQDESLTAADALKQFLSRVPLHQRVGTNRFPAPAINVKNVMNQINECVMTGTDANDLIRTLENRNKVAVKLLVFAEDVRPGYYGTFSKTSRVIGYRTPFETDRGCFNYEYESEADWEEEPEGGDAESIGSAERSAEEDNEEPEEDGWMVDDDVVEYEAGYDATGDVEMDLDAAADGDDAQVALARQRIKDRESKAKAARDGQAKKRKLAGPLVPLCKGMLWEDVLGQKKERTTEWLRIVMLNDAFVGLDPNTFVSKAIEAAPAPIAKTLAVPVAAPLAASAASAAAGGEPLKKKKAKAVAAAAAALVSKDGNASSSSSSAVVAKKKAGEEPKEKKEPKEKGPVKLLPVDVMPDFIKLVIGSERTREGLVDELFIQLKDRVGVKKGMVGATLKEAGVKASKKDGGCWDVKEEFKKLYTDSV